MAKIIMEKDGREYESLRDHWESLEEFCATHFDFTTDEFPTYDGDDESGTGCKYRLAE